MRINGTSVVRGLLFLAAATFCCLGAGNSVQAENPRVLLETSMGDIEIELYEKEAPITVENFLKYVKKGHYDETIFHRIIPNFVVQGGGMTEAMKEKPTDKPIKNESTNGLKNEKMTLSMARTRDPDSATSQFYINLKHNKPLNRAEAQDGYGYCVFGIVVSGEDVVNKMAAVPTTNRGPHQDVPKDPIILKKATILNGEKK